MIEERVVAPGDGHYYVFVRQMRDEGTIAGVELKGKTGGETVAEANRGRDKPGGGCGGIYAYKDPKMMIQAQR